MTKKFITEETQRMVENCMRTIKVTFKSTHKHANHTLQNHGEHILRKERPTRSLYNLADEFLCGVENDVRQRMPDQLREKIEEKLRNIGDKEYALKTVKETYQ